MNDKERLEEIKEKYNYERLGEFIDAKPVNPYELKWLIQQAKRVEELELEINDWRAEVQKWQQFYKKSEESHLETIGLLYSTISENQVCKGGKKVYVLTTDSYVEGKRIVLGVYTRKDKAIEESKDLDEELFCFPEIEEITVIE